MADDVISDLGAIADLAAMPDAIRRVDDAFKKLEGAGLTRRIIVLMIHDVSKVPKKQINQVLDSLPLLRDKFLTDG